MKDFLSKLFKSGGGSKAPSGKLDWTGFKSLVQTGLFVGAGTALTYVAAHIAEVDFGEGDVEMYVSAVISLVLKVLVDVFVDNSKEDEKKE